MKSIRGFVCPLPYTTGIRVGNELLVEIRIENAIYRMMQQSVTHTGFMNISWLGVGYVEGVVATMNVRFDLEFLVEIKNIVEQPILKFLYVRFLLLSPQEFLPRCKQIFYRNDIVVGIGMSDPSPQMPPPQEFVARLGANQTSVYFLA